MRLRPRYYGEVALLWSGAALLLGMLSWLFVLAPKANHALDQMNTALLTVNRPCAAGQKNCGTLAAANGAIGSLNSAAQSLGAVAPHAQTVLNSSNAAVNQFSSDLHSQMTRVGTLLDSANSTTQQLNTDLGTANKAVAGLTRTEGVADTALTSFGNTADSASELLNNRALLSTIRSLSKTSKNVSGISGDVFAVTDRFVHPPPCKTFRCRLGRIWSVIPVARNGFELYNAVTNAVGGSQIYGTVRVKK